MAIGDAKQKHTKEENQLSDEQLDAVVGGATAPTINNLGDTATHEVRKSNPIGPTGGYIGETEKNL
jgi:hypothetical protein